jgi:aquaporin NIP
VSSTDERGESIVQDRPAAAYVAEFVGTFFLVFFICAAATLGNELLVIAFVHLLALMILVYAVGGTSGAHLNPAVTVTLAVLRKIRPLDALAYLFVQLAGGIVAALLVRALFADEGEAVNYGLPVLSEPLIQGTALTGAILEGIGTFILMFAIMAVAVNPRAHQEVSGLVIGGALGLAVLVFGPVTGGSFNPARWLGPAVVSGDFSNAWAYIVGPLVGALIAGFLYTALVLQPKHRVGEPPIEKLD